MLLSKVFYESVPGLRLILSNMIAAAAVKDKTRDDGSGAVGMAAVEAAALLI